MRSMACFNFDYMQYVLTGTVVMHVGFRTVASPLLPRFILLLVSINVVGVE